MPSQNVSGIQTNLSGERHIPQSVRPDGSVRKEIKVRPGYRPPEDVEKYKNRTAEGWKSRTSSGPPGLELLDGQDDTNTGIKGKNAKRREARRRAKQADEQDPPNNADSLPEEAAPQSLSNQSDQTPVGTMDDGNSPPTDQEKQARNIKKKLRQARELQVKKESGESLLPEQFAKVIKISELIRQLDLLGFDNNGDPGSQEPH